jgi:hypothetical protein
MSIETLPDWLQEWLHVEVAAGRAQSPEDVVLTGEVLRRAQAWLEDQVYANTGIAPRSASTDAPSWTNSAR